MPITITTSPTTNLFQQAFEKYKQEQSLKPRNYPLILVVGDTGTGKTRSIKNLPIESTAILNIENKPLSFQDADKFPYQFNSFALPGDMDIMFDKCLSEPTIKYIVIDSFTKYLEMLQRFCGDVKANDKNSYARWVYYNDLVTAFLNKIKNCGEKIVILLGLPEIVEIPEIQGDILINKKQRRFAAAGKQHEGKIEKEFTIVLFTEIKWENQKANYKFVTSSDGTTSAKSPEGMFVNMRMDNDLKMVCDRVKEFYGLPA